MLDKSYRAETIEALWQANWQQSGLFTFKLQAEAAAKYSIMLPPPNVTGSLHMGHAFQDTIMDILIRYQHMSGANCLWQVGTDHAGIATQMVVERQLEAQGIKSVRQELSRSQLLEHIWDWKQQSAQTIERQMQQLGTCADWQRARFTLDTGMSLAVTTAFVRLYEDGLIYRGYKLVNWDPSLQTAVSDLEVVSEEESGHLWLLKYPLVWPAAEQSPTADQKLANRQSSEEKTALMPEYLVVATTRPETMLGDVAVAVHPEDARYQPLVAAGVQVRLPITGRLVPIIADTYVDPEFGTGCVKITPAHDFNDYEIGQRHNLDLLNIFTPTGTIAANQAAAVPAELVGLDRFCAREQILAQLQTEGLLVEIKPHQLKIPRCERTNTIIEPYLTAQWFVKAKILAEPALAAVKTGQVQFVPSNWANTYYNWLENIQDWCISRQLWWGHQIPAWYDSAGQIYVGIDEAEVRAKYQLADAVVLTQDPDVLDTWFSSALWPFSALGWPERTPELSEFYPSQVLVTGFDIIFFWVARMIMFGLKFMDQVPFHTVYVHGLIQDAHGEKMSKSKGNVLDPLDLINGISLPDLLAKRTKGLMKPEQIASIIAKTQQQFPEGIAAYGTDALRFTLATMATGARHLRFDLAKLNGYKSFANKIWNASRFVLANLETSAYRHLAVSELKTLLITSQEKWLRPEQALQLGEALQPERAFDPGEALQPEQLIAGRWIIALWQQVKLAIAKHMTAYRFDLLAQDLYEFIWNDFCDWYVEIVKFGLQAEQNLATKQWCQLVLHYVWLEVITALHPIMPHITEAIAAEFQLASSDHKFLLQMAYPQAETEVSLLGPEWSIAVEQLAQVRSLVVTIRNAKAQMQLPPKTLIKARLPVCTGPACTEPVLALVAKLARVVSIEFLTADASPIVAIEVVAAGVDKVDEANKGNNTELLYAESARLAKDLAKLARELNLANSKLQTADYLSRAPAAVVAKTKAKLAQGVDAYIGLVARLFIVRSGLLLGK